MAFVVLATLVGGDLGLVLVAVVALAIFVGDDLGRVLVAVFVLETLLGGDLSLVLVAVVVLATFVGGDLDRVEQVVKLFGIVASKDDFTEQHLVLNGCSDVMMAVFEDRGYHARSAIGTNTLPLGISVEVEAIVKIRP